MEYATGVAVAARQAKAAIRRLHALDYSAMAPKTLAEIESVLLDGLRQIAAARGMTGLGAAFLTARADTEFVGDLRAALRGCTAEAGDKDKDGES